MTRQRRGQLCNRAAGSRRLQVSRTAQKRGGGVSIIYKSGLKVEKFSTRNKFTHFEHADHYVTARGVTFRLGVV